MKHEKLTVLSTGLVEHVGSKQHLKQTFVWYWQLLVP